MRLYRIILPINDIKVAVEFYSALLDMPGVSVSEGRHYFNLGGTILACYDPQADGDDKGSWSFHHNQYIYIATPKLDEVFRKIKTLKCQHVDDKIETMPWGERLFYANDPFGNPICFVDDSTVFSGE